MPSDKRSSGEACLNQMNILGTKHSVCLLALIALGLLSFWSASGDVGFQADIVLYDATIYTADDTFPKAQAAAITGTRFTAVGSNSQIREFEGPDTLVTRLSGLTVVPGLIDANCRMLEFGRKLRGVDSAVPEGDGKEEMLAAAIDACVEVGLTGVHDFRAGPDVIELYKDLIHDGRLKLRVYAIADRLIEQPVIGLGNNMLTMRSIGLVCDEPGNPGTPTISEEELYAATKTALERGLQVCTRSTGDRAVHTVLDAYERALKDVPVSDHRLRITGATVLPPVDMPRFAELGIIPSIRPAQQVSGMRVDAWRSLLDTGVALPAGSDFPAGPHNPLSGFHAAVTRGGMTRNEALKSYTLWPAQAAFERDRKGSIVPGKLADLVILDGDIMSCPPEEIRDAKVVMTVVGGRPVYRLTKSETE